MIKAKKNDKKWLCELLSNSFDSNPSVDYIIGRRSRKKKRLALMKYSFDLCMRFGEIWISDDRKGCALLLFPHQKITDFHTVWLDFKLFFRVVGLSKLNKTLQRERALERTRTKELMAYLWFIGVDESCQHKGVGSKLLAQLIDHTKALDLPFYLETSVQSNLIWYTRFGFRQYNELDLGYRLFLLAKAV